MTAAAPRWGAWPLAAGHWTLATWAPAAQTLDVVLDGAVVPMQRSDDGWFQCTLQAAPGSRYRLRMDQAHLLADPASRWQPDGLDGPAALVDDTYAWQTPDWRGRAWDEAVLYEVHVGSAGGSFAALAAQLPQLAALGITALQLMPVAAAPGQRNWGYDGVLHYAPSAAYGAPDDLKALVDQAHGLGMMVLLDVVYNHFGPDGNPMPALAPGFFREEVHTPWGAAVDFRRPEVQAYFIDNALMWLRDYRFDGLRLDAVHAIQPRGFLDQLRDAVHAALPDRQIHLVLENEDNQASLLARGFTAQWNDDFHNALHVLLTGEREGYYQDYADDPSARLCRVLAEGFDWQGEVNRLGHARGEPSAGLPPTKFVVFAQNHDQVGNRAHGERLLQLVGPRRAAVAMALTALTPMIPMFFMGEPWGARTPFLYFTDHRAPLDEQVREGRRAEFAHFSAFRDPARRARIPDPNAPATAVASQVAWPAPDDTAASVWLGTFTALLAARAAHLRGARTVHSLGASVLAPGVLRAGWQVDDRQWWIAFNVSDRPVAIVLPAGRVVYRLGMATGDGTLPVDGFVALVTEPA